MKIDLIIAGERADLNENGLLLLTYQAADAEHPAAVKNSYSQNVTLPATPANDRIFSHLLRSDYKTGYWNFNVLARTPFELRNERQEVLVSGYLKVNGGVAGVSYDVQLFGGLGGFFYSLMYNSDGTKRTLADLSWPHNNGSGQITYIPAFSTSWNIEVSPEDFAARYNNGSDFDEGEYCPVNFAPFNEGKPKDFSADKAYYKAGDEAFSELPLQIAITEESGYKVFLPKNGVGHGVIVDFGNEHDNWAMQEFRAHQQRPLWSVKAFLRAIAYSGNTGGYEVEIDQGVFDSAYVRKGWVTLKREWGGNENNGVVPSIAPFLADTASPAEYLLSFAKICGLMFVYDSQEKKVSIMSRNAFYFKYANPSEWLALDGLLAEDKGKTITPLLMSDKWQGLAAENYGGHAEGYADRRGRQYGSLWVNTGYEFGGNENDVLADSVFKGAADVLHTSIDYRVMPRSAADGEFVSYWLKQVATDTIKYNLYTAPDAEGKQESRACEPYYDMWGFSPRYEKYYNVLDWGGVTELPELRDADGEEEDGSDVLVFYCGPQELPHGTAGGDDWEARFYATGDESEMLELNGGKPCWNLHHEAECRVRNIPVFRRQLESLHNYSWHFGLPAEWYTGNQAFVDAVDPSEYLGIRTWAKWLTERCDVDVRRMKCWVNLRTKATPKVDAELLRRFWHYGGALWVLDKINAHSLTTDDLTECEFIKVIDKNKYIYGQDFD